MSIKDWINDWLKNRGDNSLRTLSNQIEKNGSSVSISTLQRLTSQNGLPRKKTIEAIETVLGIYDADKYSKNYYLIGLSSEEAPAESPEQRAWALQKNLCPICESALYDRESVSDFRINTHKLKKLDTWDLLETELSQCLVFTCNTCSEAFKKVADMSYPNIITCLIDKGDGQLTVFDPEKGKTLPITNQSLLSQRLGVVQSTISRIASTKTAISDRGSIEWININTARTLHILCAKRILNKNFKFSSEVTRDIIIDELIEELVEHGYSKNRCTRHYRLEYFANNPIYCDLLVSDGDGKNAIACFVATPHHSEKSRNYYLGIGIAIGAACIVIAMADEQIQRNFTLHQVYRISDSDDYALGVEYTHGLPYSEPHDDDKWY
ncbi:MAG: hypothetical protein ACJAS1_001859 [Oleiphilaceae bacterium]|jgi:hypothetical protein